jgi:hypothetical protein
MLEPEPCCEAWPLVLSGLKLLLETGKALPAVYVEAALS